MQEKSEIDVLIAKLFSETISPEEKNILTTWLNEDADNRVYFDQLRNIWHVSHPAFDPETIDVNMAEKKVMGKIKKCKLTHTSIIMWWQRIAAVLFIPLLFLTIYLINKSAPLAAKVVYQEVFSPYGMRSMVNLSDGTVVWLNSGSKLRYPVTFKDGERYVFLSGEAYFEVHSDKNNSFIVKTGEIKVKATGTVFNVEAYPTDTIVAVTLVRGKVYVNINHSENLEMKPKDRLCYNNNSKSYELTQTDTYKWCAWKDGVLAFRDDRLDYVFKKIGQMYNVDIEVKSPIIASQLYHATFKEESFDEILRLMRMSAPIWYKKTNRVKLPDGQFSKEKIEVYQE